MKHAYLILAALYSQAHATSLEVEAEETSVTSTSLLNLQPGETDVIPVDTDEQEDTRVGIGMVGITSISGPPRLPIPEGSMRRITSFGMTGPMQV